MASLVLVHLTPTPVYVCSMVAHSLYKMYDVQVGSIKLQLCIMDSPLIQTNSAYNPYTSTTDDGLCGAVL